MSFDLNSVQSERLLCRRDSQSLLLRRYVLSVSGWADLVNEGFDPETVAEDELARRAIRICHYDALGRLTQEICFFVSTPLTITYEMDMPSATEQESEC